jgi:NADPH:quinone reductase-like Zn-dependent oxidoreductase
MSYQQIIITRHGGREVLQLIDAELPEPKADEVRVKIIATGVAFTDVLIREGLYPGVPKPPFSPGYEIVGVVDKIGSQVSNLTLQQRVVALTIVGGYSQYLCLPATELIPIPETVDAEDAVCLVLQYVTAYQMLHRIARVKPGERILIHGAAGGVGTALLELGKRADLEMYGTASLAKHELIYGLGGIPIDYKQEDFVQKIRTLTHDGVDVVFDGIGSNHLIQSYKTLRRGGRLISYGFSSVLKQKYARILGIAYSFLVLSLLKLLPDGRKVEFYSISSLKQSYPERFREDLTKLLGMLAHQEIKPIISDRLPLREAIRAHELIDTSAISGQLVLICN